MIKRIASVIIFISLTLFAMAQPETIESNATAKDSMGSLLFQRLGKNYDFILGFTETSFWLMDRSNYKAIALKNGNWEVIELSGFKRRKGKGRMKISLYTRPVASDSVIYLIYNLTTLNFWTLNNSLLSENGVRINDSVTRRMVVTDGVTQRFEIITPDKFRIIEVHEPETYLNEFPEMMIKKTFVNCRKLFLAAWKNS